MYLIQNKDQTPEKICKPLTVSRSHDRATVAAVALAGPPLEAQLLDLHSYHIHSIIL